MVINVNKQIQIQVIQVYSSIKMRLKNNAYGKQEEREDATTVLANAWA